MSNTITQTVPQTKRKQETIFRQLLADMNLLEEQMDRDRAESERLKMEATAIKAETQIIKACTEANLTRLQERVNAFSN